MTGDPVIEGEVAEVQDVDNSKALAQWSPQFVVSVDEAVRRSQQVVEYMRKVLRDGIHYGVIPGTGSKPTLLKAGAQALMRDMNLHPEAVVLEHVADVMGADHGGEPFLAYVVRQDLYTIAKSGERVWVGSGIGSCNSWEERYRWRTAVRTCPECHKPALIRGKKEYAPGVRDHGRPDAGFEQGGWVCFRKKDGCGASFPDKDPRIIDQETGKVPNDRVMDLDNTIAKQAAKRAMVEAVLNVTGASDVFTQDLEEGTSADDDEEERARAMEAVRASRSQVQDHQSTVPTEQKPPSADHQQLVTRAAGLWTQKAGSAKAYVDRHKLGLSISAWKDEDLSAFIEAMAAL